MNDAIEKYVRSERVIVAGINEAIADFAAGRVVPHEVVMQRIRATIDRVEKQGKWQ